MKRWMWLILLLTVTLAYGAPPKVTEWSRVLTTKPAAGTQTGDIKGVMGIMSSASGKFVVRLPADSIGGGGAAPTGNLAFKQMSSAIKGSVLKPYAVETTAPDGEHGVECYNTGDFSTVDLTMAKAGTFCFNQTLQKYRAWDGTGIVDLGTLIGLAPSSGGGGGEYVTPPTYRDSPCTQGQQATGNGNHYLCTATNTWEVFAYGTQLAMTPTSATINIAAKTVGPNTPGTGLSAPNDGLSYYYYSTVTPSATGTITMAHWNMYSNGTNASSKMEVYSSDGGTLVCTTPAVTGSASTNQLIDSTMSCSVNNGTSYLVGVCMTADSTAYNGPYVQASTGGPATNRVQKPCDGTAFSTAGATVASATRPIYAWGDNSATR